MDDNRLTGRQHQSWLVITAPSLIIYDLDGTLVNSLGDIVCTVNEVRRQLMLPSFSKEAVMHWIGQGIPTLLKQAMADATHLKAQASQLFDQIYKEMCGHHSTVFPGVKAFLACAQAQGIAQAVVTNKPCHFAEHLLVMMELKSYFPVVYGGDSLHKRKPHPLPLITVMNKLECEPDSTIMVGDSINDIQAAKAARIRSVGVTYGYNYGCPIQDAQPDWVVDNLMSLTK